MATDEARRLDRVQENSIEIYDDNNFVRKSIMTRSARMRKFKFYQYKPIHDNTPKILEKEQINYRANNDNTSSATSAIHRDPSPSPEPAILIPREDVLQGKILPNSELSKDLADLDNQIAEIENNIADLNRDDLINNGDGGINKLDKKFELVNKKNDLLRRQMQLNILQQERALEKANEELTKELRSLMSIDDSRKTKAQMERQQYLYSQSLALVNRRNELVLHLDYQEREIEQDNAVKAKLKSVISENSNRNASRGPHNQEQNCSIQ